MMNKVGIKRESGQMMILLVIMVSAAALAAMALSSFLVVAQLRQVTDARLSGGAIFAADEGIECVLMHEFNKNVYDTIAGSQCPTFPETIDECTGEWSSPMTLVPQGATYKFRCDRENSQMPARKIFVAAGQDRPLNPRVTRALQITLIKLGSTECSDGIDNDGDGRIDFLSDPGCSSGADNSEG